MSGQLGSLGWAEYCAHANSPNLGVDPREITGRVRRVDRGEADVLTEVGEIRALSDSQRAQSEVAPATGDWVRIRTDGPLGPVVSEVLPRYSAIVRRDPSEEVIEQVLAANVDLVGVVAGVDRPANIARVERFLVIAADSGADALVIVTKTDLGLTDEWHRLAAELGDVEVLHTSVVDRTGMDELGERIRPNRTLVLLGESGSGKSSLVNSLVGATVQDTTPVRARDAKGRHTTTARELVVVPSGGVVIDTPGVRGVGLWDAGPAVDRVFADIVDLAAGCRFNDCSHRVEPGCEVMAAVEGGTLDEQRLARYLRLRDELEEQAAELGERRRGQRGASS